MRVIVVAAAAVVLASCTTGQTAAPNMGAAPQASTANDRDAPTPAALRVPRQRGNGWPDIGYSPYGNN